MLDGASGRVIPPQSNTGTSRLLSKFTVPKFGMAKPNDQNTTNQNLAPESSSMSAEDAAKKNNTPTTNSGGLFGYLDTWTEPIIGMVSSMKDKFLNKALNTKLSPEISQFLVDMFGQEASNPIAWFLSPLGYSASQAAPSSSTSSPSDNNTTGTVEGTGKGLKDAQDHGCMDYYGPIGKVTKITIHYTAGNADASWSSIDSIGKSKGWKGINYHFLITSDGQVHKGVPESSWGPHTARNHEGNIGISYTAPENQAPNQAQRDSMEQMIADLCYKYDLNCNRSTVKGHYERDIEAYGTQGTNCPGAGMMGIIDDVVNKAQTLKPTVSEKASKNPPPFDPSTDAYDNLSNYTGDGLNRKDQSDACFGKPQGTTTRDLGGSGRSTLYGMVRDFDSSAFNKDLDSLRKMDELKPVGEIWDKSGKFGISNKEIKYTKFGMKRDSGDEPHNTPSQLVTNINTTTELKKQQQMQQLEEENYGTSRYGKAGSSYLFRPVSFDSSDIMNNLPTGCFPGIPSVSSTPDIQPRVKSPKMIEDAKAEKSRQTKESILRKIPSMSFEELQDLYSQIDEEQVPTYNRINTNDDDLGVIRSKLAAIIQHEQGTHNLLEGETKQKPQTTITESPTKLDPETQEPVLDEKGLNGRHFTVNDVQYLLDNGYTKKDALDFLNTDPKYKDPIKPTKSSSNAINDATQKSKNSKENKNRFGVKEPTLNEYLAAGYTMEEAMEMMYEYSTKDQDNFRKQREFAQKRAEKAAAEEAQQNGTARHSIFQNIFGTAKEEQQEYQAPKPKTLNDYLAAGYTMEEAMELMYRDSQYMVQNQENYQKQLAFDIARAEQKRIEEENKKRNATSSSESINEAQRISSKQKANTSASETMMPTSQTAEDAQTMMDQVFGKTPKEKQDNDPSKDTKTKEKPKKKKMNIFTRAAGWIQDHILDPISGKKKKKENKHPIQKAAQEIKDTTREETTQKPLDLSNIEPEKIENPKERVQAHVSQQKQDIMNEAATSQSRANKLQETPIKEEEPISPDNRISGRSVATYQQSSTNAAMQQQSPIAETSNKISEAMLVALNKNNDLLANILAAIQGLAASNGNSTTVTDPQTGKKMSSTAMSLRSALSSFNQGSNTGIGDAGLSGDGSRGNPMNIYNSMSEIVTR